MPSTASELIDSFLSRHAAPERLALSLGDLRLDVATNSRPLRDWLADYFRDFPSRGGDACIEITAIEAPAQDLGIDYAAKAPDPGKHRIKEEYHDFPDGRAVRKRLTGMVFAFGGGRHLAVGPCLENPNQVVNFVNNRFIEHHLKRGCLLGHAAAVAGPSAGLALAGFSGMGKSTLALTIMCQSQVSFVSNDRLLVERGDSGLVMRGVAKMPRVNPGTVLNNPCLGPVMSEEDRARFQALDRDELWELEHKYDAFIDQCFGPNRFRLVAPMRGLVLLNWRRGEGAVVPRMVDVDKRRDLLQAFMKNVGLFFEETDALESLDLSEDRYVAMLKDCEVLELSGGIDFQAGAEHCLKLLDRLG